MAGTLYVVGTPIGNLSDLSPRAVETLRAVDFIVAEDTRVTLKLLNHFGIKKPQVSYYEHNLREKGEQIVQRLLAGESCAIVTDAGMPCISDPGEDLVRLCAEQNIPVTAVPGPSAAITALAVSGLLTARFAFEGFLSMNRKRRMERLEQIRGDDRTLIFYEAPHKLRDTLKDLLEGLGDRRVSLCRELTYHPGRSSSTLFPGGEQAQGGICAGGGGGFPRRAGGCHDPGGGCGAGKAPAGGGAPSLGGGQTGGQTVRAEEKRHLSGHVFR